jgi:hypothetical protein
MIDDRDLRWALSAINVKIVIARAGSPARFSITSERGEQCKSRGLLRNRRALYARLIILSAWRERKAMSYQVRRTRGGKVLLFLILDSSQCQRVINHSRRRAGIERLDGEFPRKYTLPTLQSSGRLRNII